ncbi:hypothetical protein [Mycolicibacterium monacense]|uniref:hypothetical protein n=1 Tax=Mycolicibacterium monacense TaxID=85693 RepID=UPI001F2BC492|nr:hypothetical protein [Mycolicibacterium monacense]
MTAIQAGVMARNRTPAALAAQRPQPPRTYTPSEHRERRRTGLPAAHYDGTWSLAREIADVVGPLAQRIAADDRPTGSCAPLPRCRGWPKASTRRSASSSGGWPRRMPAAAPRTWPTSRASASTP